jgi:benzoate-CoA ligase family protein
VKAADLPARYNAADILDRNVPNRARKTALSGPAGARSFAEVAEEANRVGNALRTLGLRPGDRVALVLPDLPEWPACFFGTLKAGGIALGVNTLLTPAEHAYILADSEARVLIMHAGLRAAVASALSAASASAKGGLPDLEHVVIVGGQVSETAADLGKRRPVHDYEPWIAAASPELDPAPTLREDLATLNYSSGTTGTPKGIPHAHQDLPLSAELWGVRCLGLREEDVSYSNAKLFFTYGLGGGMLFPWTVGAGTILNPGPARETATVLRLIERHRPTVFFNAPTGYAAMLAVPDLAGSHDLSSLRLCVSAGEALPAPVWHAWKKMTGLEIIDGIGSTELFHIFISNRPGEVRPGSSGRPVEGYQTRVLGDDGHPVERGAVGNLWVRGETAAPFYLNQEELTGETFVGGWVLTGDKYHVDEEGYYWHAGRKDDMLKVGGIWVSPVEVESALAGHPAVIECAVVGMPDADDLIKPKAWVVVAPGFEPSTGLAEELIAHCAREMAAYKRPRWIEFVANLPKTATGKIQRFKLRESFATSGSAAATFSSRAPNRAPSSGEH